MCDRWLPIESAPRDGTWVFLYSPTLSIGLYPLVGFDCGDGWEFPAHKISPAWEPTHFMPLPSPPVQP